MLLALYFSVLLIGVQAQESQSLTSARPKVCPDGSTPVVCVRAPCPPCPSTPTPIPIPPPADTCKLPSETGPCKALIPRYFFNYKTNQCEKFTYGGCGGNANNFKTIDECIAACAGTTVPSLPPSFCGKENFPCGGNFGGKCCGGLSCCFASGPLPTLLSVGICGQNCLFKG